MKLYKLTDALNQTRGATQWGPGVEHTADGKGEMCSEHFLHAYTDPLLAVCMDPAHCDFGRAGRLWLADGDAPANDGTKVGCTRLRTVRRIPKPRKPARAVLTRWAIYCAKHVTTDARWLWWAAWWLNGKDRTASAASAAYASASASAASAAYYAAEVDASGKTFDAAKLLHKAVRDERKYKEAKRCSLK